MNPKISLIAAIGKNSELGKGNKLLFDIPEDMKMFKEKTSGHVVIMGRKTYESIGHPLSNRINIIITHDSSFIIHDSSAKVVHSIEEALGFAKSVESPPAGGEIFVIGGAQIYQLAMPFADKLYLTIVNKTVKDADAFFPDYSEFKIVLYERPSRDKNYSYTFLDLAR